MHQSGVANIFGCEPPEKVGGGAPGDRSGGASWIGWIHRALDMAAAVFLVESGWLTRGNERVHCTTYATRAKAEAGLFECIEIFYNRSRRHATLGYNSPKQLLQDWLRKQADQHPKAA